jgi:hypothetical protein
MTRAVYLCLTLLCLIIICAWESAEVKSTESSPTVAQASNQLPSSPQLSGFAEPPISDDKVALELVWQRFVAGGQYHLARAGEMKFSDPAKNRIFVPVRAVAQFWR